MYVITFFKIIFNEEIQEWNKFPCQRKIAYKIQQEKIF